MGADFAVVPADVEELSAGDPREVALENARRKATAVAGRGHANVLGVDTLVALDGRIYGKPADAAQARATLRALSGRTHQVVSGVHLDGSEAVAVTAVTFRDAEPLLDWYLATEEWRGRAGGYAVQGAGAALVTRIEGDYLNVVGLPLATLIDLAGGP